MKRALQVVAGLLVLLAVAVFVGFYVDGTSPSAPYSLDLKELESLADSLPGEKPLEVRYERVANFRVPTIGTESGASWAKVDMPASSYQLVFDGGTGLIDTAFDEATSRKSLVESFDAPAFGHVAAAMEKADFIVVTHEHFDHLGGFVTHPRAEALAPKLKVTAEQLADPSKLEPLTLPAGLREKLTPVSYAQSLAIAPGVVLHKAAGHSPGSQLVFVKLQNGAEYLFIGDVAWQQQNIDDLHGRPRLVSALMLKEDRGAVAAQLQALKTLEQTHPEVHIVAGHDDRPLDALVKAGLLVRGFVN